MLFHIFSEPSWLRPAGQYGLRGKADRVFRETGAPPDIGKENRHDQHERPVFDFTRSRPFSLPDGSSNRRGLVWTDLTGALGDIGVLLPLAAALIAVNGLNPTTLFACAGLYYVVSGIAFRLPVPVQPLKALAALAVTHAAAPSVIAAGGLLLGLLFLLLVATGLLSRVASLFTSFIVRGSSSVWAFC